MGTQMKHFLAFDLGASSGRAMLGCLDNGNLTLEEIHRFENGGVEVNGSLFWNILSLFTEMKTGLKKAIDSGVKLAGMAIDTWGVDFALLDRRGDFVGFPYHYRDRRTDSIYPYAFSKVPREGLYARTGIQFMSLNTVFQLAAMKRDNSPALETAERLLLMPNALTYLFSGNASAEYTIATTSQLYDPAGKDWAWDVIDALEIPRKLFPEIVAPGTVVGELSPAICEELRCDPVPVILAGSHDTASAVAAAPAVAGPCWAYLSSGTWSLLGVELDSPLISPAALEANYTNEGGIGGKIRFLKNIMGLWLVQESRAEWARQGADYSFDELSDMAAAAEPFRSLIDPNDEGFAAPGDMPGRIAKFCVDTGQPAPTTPGEVVRCALESLALRYRQTVCEIEEIVGCKVEVLHLVGGGSKDELLNQFAANALQRRVVTGPVEATALGNVVCQAMAVGEVRGLDEARAIIRSSVETGEHSPQDAAPWGAAYERYRKLLP